MKKYLTIGIVLAIIIGAGIYLFPIIKKKLSGGQSNRELERYSDPLPTAHIPGMTSTPSKVTSSSPGIFVTELPSITKGSVIAAVPTGNGTIKIKDPYRPPPRIIKPDQPPPRPNLTVTNSNIPHGTTQGKITINPITGRAFETNFIYG